LVGINIVGDAPPYTLHAGFSFYKDDQFFIYYASSTDSGANWTTTTVDDISFYDEVEEEYLGFYNPISFSVDSSGNPAFNYQALIDLDSVGVIVTSSVRYAYRKMMFGPLQQLIQISLSDYVECVRFVPSDLSFYGDVPVLGYVGDEFEPKLAVNTQYFFCRFSTSTAMDCISDMGVGV
jgi:hypothetical protein